MIEMIEMNGIFDEWEYKEIFEAAFDKFKADEKDILENDLNERTITHKLAEHLKNSFWAKGYEYDVDCEYNRMRKETMDANSDYVTKRLNLRELPGDHYNSTQVFPDIIIHIRNDNEANYLIVEFKKTNYADQARIEDENGNVIETYRQFDKRKIRAYITRLHYQYGIYVEFNGTKLNELVSYFLREVDE
jgi:hypothetical protein